MEFEASGFFKKKGIKKRFSKKVNAKNKALAREKALSLLGSEHKLKRRFIEIMEINELK